MRRVGGVVLDPDLAQPEALGQPVGLHQRRDAGRESGLRPLLEGQEVRVAPDVLRAALDAALDLRGVEAGEVVGHLERAETYVADVASRQLVTLAAFLALESFQRAHVAPTFRGSPPSVSL